MKKRLLAIAPAVCDFALLFVPAGKTAAYLCGWELTLYNNDVFLATVMALVLASTVGLMVNKTILGRWGRAFSVPVSYTHLDVYKRQSPSSRSHSGCALSGSLRG